MLTQRPVGTDDVGKHIGLQEVLGYVELWPKHIVNFWQYQCLPDVRVPSGVSPQLEDCHVIVEGPGIVAGVPNDLLHAVSAIVRFVV